MSDIKPDIKPLASPFDAEPEEHLAVSGSYNQSFVWAIKVPRFLLEQWEQVDETGVELGTLVVDTSTKPERITLRLPSAPSSDSEDPLVALPSASSSAGGSASVAGPSRLRRRYDTRNLPDEYEVRYHPAKVRNTYVFSETVRTPQVGRGPDGRKKREKAQPTLHSRVQHEATLQPVRNPKYLRILQQRQLEAQGSKRPIIQLEQSGMSEARLAQLASGYTNWASDFGQNVSGSAPKPSSADRNARLDRSDLTDRLFALFAERPYWGIKALRETLRQPDAWLREVLRDVGEVVDEGPYRNMWRVKAAWKALEEEGRRAAAEVAGGAKAEPGAGDGGAAEEEEEDEGDGDGDEWDDDWDEGNEDMEEVRME